MAIECVYAFLSSAPPDMTDLLTGKLVTAPPPDPGHFDAARGSTSVRMPSVAWRGQAGEG